ncbi:hypothetical protein GCM10009678_20230 [Actinomadura kijaniata]|uniref:Lipoprotein n=1 Tax=Actinomadura namibiensis TaxID=182080 RepID=A0A7W3LJ21_ACTNM|nr:hypothetical protein [Actinomadura namibiensis]MBA8949005.1 hypothetical protein [Actinomadura namibiensis]
MRRLSFLLAVPLLAAACGGGSEPAAAPPTPSDAAQLKYSRCLREHGVDMPDDPKKIPAGGMTIPERARKACAGVEPQGKTIDMNDPATKDRFARFAKCMRANGYDMPDNAPPDVHLRNPRKWEQSYAKCDHILREGRK